MPWLFGLALLAGYAVLVPVLGLMIASIIYFPVVAMLSGYELAHGRWWIIAVMTAGVGAFLFVFAHFLRIPLPVGLLGW